MNEINFVEILNRLKTSTTSSFTKILDNGQRFLVHTNWKISRKYFNLKRRGNVVV